jgi:hypothetical protein
MTLRNIWSETLVENELSRQEQVLRGESRSILTRNQADKLIARYHLELVSVTIVHLLDSFDIGNRWYVKSSQR